MGKTRDLFKKIRGTKGTFHAKMSLIKEVLLANPDFHKKIGKVVLQGEKQGQKCRGTLPERWFNNVSKRRRQVM